MASGSHAGSRRRHSQARGSEYLGVVGLHPQLRCRLEGRLARRRCGAPVQDGLRVAAHAPPTTPPRRHTALAACQPHGPRLAVPPAPATAPSGRTPGVQGRSRACGTGVAGARLSMAQGLGTGATAPGPLGAPDVRVDAVGHADRSTRGTRLGPRLRACKREAGRRPGPRHAASQEVLAPPGPPHAGRGLAGRRRRRDRLGRRASIRGAATSGRCGVGHSTDPPHTRHGAPTAYLHLSQLPNPTSYETLVAEDKDRAAAWLCCRWSYQWRCLRCILGDGTWERTNMTPAEAAQALYVDSTPSSCHCGAVDFGRPRARNDGRQAFPAYTAL